MRHKSIHVPEPQYGDGCTHWVGFCSYSTRGETEIRVSVAQPTYRQQKSRVSQWIVKVLRNTSWSLIPLLPMELWNFLIQYWMEVVCCIFSSLHPKQKRLIFCCINETSEVFCCFSTGVPWREATIVADRAFAVGQGLQHCYSSNCEGWMGFLQIYPPILLESRHLVKLRVPENDGVELWESCERNRISGAYHKHKLWIVNWKQVG